jgi:hypothetical protein
MLWDACDTFFRNHRSAMACAAGRTPTHLNLRGGKYHMTPALERLFMREYSLYMKANRDAGDADSRTFKHITEILSERFPFFVDMDVFDDAAPPVRVPGVPCTAPAEATMDVIGAWASSMSLCLKRCVPAEYDAESAVATAPTAVFNGVDVTAPRNALRPWECVVAAAPARLIAKSDGRVYRKTGVHVIWPTLIVDKEMAKRLRELICTALYDSHPGREWNDIVDVSVYRNLSSLRMIGSYKAAFCKECKSKDAQYKARDALSAKLAAHIRKINPRNAAVPSTPHNLVKLAEGVVAGRTGMMCGRERISTNNETLNLSRQLLVARAALPCPCNGFLRKTDVEAGCYALEMIIGGERCERLQDVEALMNDEQDGILRSVYAVSVRRPDGTPLTPLALPARAPAPATVTFREPRPEDKENLDANGYLRLPVVRVGPASPPHAPRLTRHDIDDPHAIALVQNYLRSQALGPQYSDIQVRKLYRLYNPARKPKPADANVDGSAFYTVIASVRGMGSCFCHTVGRDHTSSTIHFEFTPSQEALQKCWSAKDPLCKKAPGRRDPKVPHRVYTRLFPMTRRTVDVLPEEVAAWENGTLPESFVKAYADDLICIPRSGTFFRQLIGTKRERLAREAAREADAVGRVFAPAAKRARKSPKACTETYELA